MTYLQDNIPPSTFEEMYVDPTWSGLFLDWAEQQPDWTGPLTRALFGMARWSGGLDDARDIVIDLRLASPPLEPSVTVLDPDLVADGSGSVPGDFFEAAYANAYEVLANDRFVYPTFYHDRTQKQADAAVGRRRAGEAKRGVPDDELTEYVTTCNVWVQTPYGPPEILQSEPGEADYYWQPTDAQLADGVAANETAVKDAGDGETLPFWQLFEIVLIGEHGKNLMAYKTICRDYGAEGTVTVEKGSAFSSGSLTFVGAHDPDAVRRHVAQFSKKTCRFE